MLILRIAGQGCAAACSMLAVAASTVVATPSIHALLIGVLGIVPFLRIGCCGPVCPVPLHVSDSIGNRRCPAQARSEGSGTSGAAARSGLHGQTNAVVDPGEKNLQLVL